MQKFCLRNSPWIPCKRADTRRPYAYMAFPDSDNDDDDEEKEEEEVWKFPKRSHNTGKKDR